MRNVPINEAETIFEPFWDGGESYPCPEKYSVLKNYRITYAPDAIARITPSWFGARIDIQKGGSDGFDAVMERDCELSIEGYDIFRIFASLPENMQVTITCRIDGEDTGESDQPYLGWRPSDRRQGCYRLPVLVRSVKRGQTTRDGGKEKPLYAGLGGLLCRYLHGRAADWYLYG